MLFNMLLVNSEKTLCFQLPSVSKKPCFAFGNFLGILKNMFTAFSLFSVLLKKNSLHQVLLYCSMITLVIISIN